MSIAWPIDFIDAFGFIQVIEFITTAYKVFVRLLTVLV